MNILSILTYGTWFLSEIIFNRLLHSKNTDRQHEDKGSLIILWIIIFMANFTAVLITNWYNYPILNNYIIMYAGLLIIIIGVILRLIIIVTLGQFFTVDVTIRQDHRLKIDGFYKFIRHPSYSASILSFIGFGISLNNWISLIIITVSIFIAFNIRIKIEEKVLIGHFGSEYLDYKNKTKRLLPFIY